MTWPEYSAPSLRHNFIFLYFSSAKAMSFLPPRQPNMLPKYFAQAGSGLRRTRAERGSGNWRLGKVSLFSRSHETCGVAFRVAQARSNRCATHISSASVSGFREVRRVWSSPHPAARSSRQGRRDKTILFRVTHAGPQISRRFRDNFPLVCATVPRTLPLPLAHVPHLGFLACYSAVCTWLRGARQQGAGTPPRAAASRHDVYDAQ